MSILAQVFTLDLDHSVFFTLARHSERELVALHELGVTLFEPEGKAIWHYWAGDIITGWDLLPEGRRLTIWDDVQVVLD